MLASVSCFGNAFQFRPSPHTRLLPKTEWAGGAGSATAASPESPPPRGAHSPPNHLPELLAGRWPSTLMACPRY